MSQRKPWFLSLVRRYVHRRLRREFDGVWVAGLSEAAALLRQGPVIFAPTHVSWWDAFLVVAVDQALDSTSHCLMDAENLRKLPFFVWIGALPIDRAGGARARAGLLAGAQRAQKPGEALWVFPQGRQRPSHLRPLDLQPGIRLVERLSPAPIVPVALTYLFRQTERPAALLRFGRPISGPLLPELEAALIDGLSEIDRFVDTGQGPFVPLIGGPATAAQAGIGARALVSLHRPEVQP
jgi:1-acyl-sn-glycerol-3-phosphate acyltransferase